VWSVVQIHSSRPISISIVPKILLTNDDGVESEGLSFLAAAAEGLGEVIVVAPDRERSAVSHGLTIHSPLSINQLDTNRYALDGTPADCVIYALTHILTGLPDLVISGINHGANLGDDIMYSGTVAAAREASRHGIPALAVSQAYEKKPVSFQAVDFIRRLIQSMLEGPPQAAMCLNVNIPAGKIRGVKVTRQGCANHFPHFNALASTEVEDGRRQDENGQNPDLTIDFHAVVDRFISVTPLQRDQTDYNIVPSLVNEVPKLFSRSLFPGIRLIGHQN
jgi:5'-nucleotidase